VKCGVGDPVGSRSARTCGSCPWLLSPSPGPLDEEVSKGCLHHIAHGCSRQSFRWPTVVCDDCGRSGYQVVDGAGCGRRCCGLCGCVVRACE
jgi:hypothetical protein